MKQMWLPQVFICSIICLALITGFTPLRAAGPATRTLLSDGVELWTPAQEPKDMPIFFVKVQEMINGFLPSDIPFGRSVAFLVGVSDYKHINNQLPFVKNDLEDMRDYLLQRGGFDEVYVAYNSVVSHDLVEDYMMNKFPHQLKKRDRLLFYYAGHGADAAGTTGYLQFSNAQRGNFAKDVLAVSRVQEWSRVNPAAHMLFLLDTCSSGLAFTSRSGSEEDDQKRFISTLSGAGSRTVITAGTADEKTFEVKTSKSHGNGVFTRALLDALGVGRHKPASAFITIDQVFADAKIRVEHFANRSNNQLHPKLWTLEDAKYRGSFIFLNSAAKVGQITARDLGLSNGMPRSITESEGTEGASQEPIILMSNLSLTPSYIFGFVTANGQPISGARVTFTGPRASLTGATEANGRFEIEYRSTYPGDGVYDFIVEKAGFTSTQIKISITNNRLEVMPDGWPVGTDTIEIARRLGSHPKCNVKFLIKPDDVSVYLDGKFIGRGDVVTKNGIDIDDALVHRVNFFRPGVRTDERKISKEQCNGIALPSLQ